MMWNDKKFIKDIIKISYTKSEVLKRLGYRRGGTTVYKLNEFIKDNNVDISHFRKVRRIGKRWRDKEKIKIVVSSSKCISDVLRMLGLKTTGSNFKTAKKYIEKYEVDISHFDPHANKIGGAKAIPLNDILIEDSSYLNNSNLKQKLLGVGLLEYRCYNCGNDGVWLEEKLTLQLEHKNGKSNDHRIENLELLCPNCHSQTKTFAGRNVNTDER